ncbi:MAG: hypothetical protein AAB350_03375 [Patescibacteria group bacterium]
MWSFAIINNRLTEIFFTKKRGKLLINGHCYVEKSEYKTKKEQKEIKEDIKKYKFTYRNKIYRDKIKNIKISLTPFDW